MKRVAVFGNAGGGKSALARRIAASKRVHHLKSPAEMRAFLKTIKREVASA